ncbi:MAG: excinuclease ABC subunit UvrC [Bacillota bacterium]
MLEEDLQALPGKPGVYMMLDKERRILYVGKAVSLKNRVRSYFQNSRHTDPRISAMVLQVTAVDYITTSSEMEALVLENNLIKEHRPKYNVRLRDDKTYPYLKINRDDDFPTVQVVRRIADARGKYYGPYTDVTALRETVRLIRRLFPVRTCKLNISGDKPDRPCLNFHIKRCLGPCTGNVSREAYGEVIRQVYLFLEGRQDELLDFLKGKMDEAATRMDFEKAAVYRDRMRDILKVQEKQRAALSGRENLDVVGLAKNDGKACVQIFLIRRGKLGNREHYFLDQVEGAGDKEIMSAFLTGYYEARSDLPAEVLLPAEPEDLKVIQAWLKEKTNRKVILSVPRRGERKKLLDLAAQNAELLLARAELSGSHRDEFAGQALKELAHWINLDRIPERIECFDISNFQGNETVASMAVFRGGIPAKEAYRKFKIRTVSGPDDFASLQEAIGRRFARGLEDRKKGAGPPGKFADFPDLLVIDGGKGQLSSVTAVLETMGLQDLKVIGLAKENEEVFLPGCGDPLLIPRDSEALYLLQRVRDEAHRFALSYHRRLRGKETVKSALDDIPGIGPRRKKALLQKFGSVKRIREAAEKDLLSVKGITPEVVKRIKEIMP